MRIRTSFFFALAALLLVSTLVLNPMTLAAQESDPAPAESTPGETQPAYRFAIVPVGDHPEGFFDDVEIAPGETRELSVIIASAGAIPVELKTYKTNSVNPPNGGFSTGNEKDDPTGLTSWINYPTETFTLEPDTQREITFSVTVPDDATPGQYISSLIVETSEPLDATDGGPFQQVFGNAISIGILVPGEMTYAFELGAPELHTDDDLRILQIPVSNTGSYLVRPAGSVTLTNGAGEEVLTSEVAMQAVYAGNSTTAELLLPNQLAPGDYSVSVSLADKDLGGEDAVEGSITLPISESATGIFVTNAAIEPNADPIAFANVNLTLDNRGKEIPATNVTLDVLHDGEAFDSFPLATNQVLLEGENTFTTRYIPPTDWEAGNYAFQIKVSAVDPKGGQETILLTEDLEATLQVP